MHPASLLAILLFAVLCSGFTAFPSTAAPFVSDNGDASKTVAWSMADPSLAFAGIELAGDKATLPWTRVNVTWTTPSRFAANGSLDANLTADGTGLSLRADPTNYAIAGDFAVPLPWRYEASPGGNITASWDASNEAAVLRSATSESLWDGMDSASGWNSVNGAGAPFVNRTAHREGTGMLGLNFSLPSTPGSFAGLGHATSVDWSAADRMAVWILSPAVATPLSFNLTAYVGANLLDTAARPLVPGWQEVVVDLGELGPLRNVLVLLTLRVSGLNVPASTIYFDDLRIGNAARFNETAYVRQDTLKANATSTDPGTAALEFNWSLTDPPAGVRAVGVVNLTGPSGSFEGRFAGPAGPGWTAFTADVSGTTAAAGTYTLSLGLQVAVGNRSAAAVEARFDDVVLRFPNRRNGTYLSAAIALPAASEFLTVAWTLDAAGPTSVRTSLRSGNETTPGSASWGPWRSWTASGTFAADLPGAGFIQVQAHLMTTNASATPVVRGMDLAARHRAPFGTVSGIFSVPSDPPFRHWRTLNATLATPGGTSIAFSVGDGTYWQSAEVGMDLSAMTISPIHWSATLRTSDGLATPSLQRVALVYDYSGPVTRVVVTSLGALTVPSGAWLRLNATAFDAGDHAVVWDPSRFVWTTDDGAGEVYGNGSYRAGNVGDHNVTARLSGTNRSATVRVTVGPAVVRTPDGFAMVGIYGLGMLAVAAVGLVGYQVVIRRRFAIDDVFLISKDGRLMMHNTRRMRADRDEDILSGMLTAILAFLKDSDPEENGDLKRFEVGGKTTLLERGAHAYLAAVYSGRVPRWAGKDLRRFMTGLEANFGEVFARWSGDPEDLQGLKDFTSHFVSRVRYRPPRGANGRAA